MGRQNWFLGWWTALYEAVFCGVDIMIRDAKQKEVRWENIEGAKREKTAREVERERCGQLQWLWRSTEQSSVLHLSAAMMAKWALPFTGEGKCPFFSLNDFIYIFNHAHKLINMFWPHSCCIFLALETWINDERRQEGEEVYIFIFGSAVKKKDLLWTTRNWTLCTPLCKWSGLINLD